MLKKNANSSTEKKKEKLLDVSVLHTLIRMTKVERVAATG